eukprot:scaffold4518_cov410-Prasinococcus_capsulatus_cf.AAC.29
MSARRPSALRASPWPGRTVRATAHIGEFCCSLQHRSLAGQARLHNGKLIFCLEIRADLPPIHLDQLLQAAPTWTCACAASPARAHTSRPACRAGLGWRRSEASKPEASGGPPESLAPPQIRPAPSQRASPKTVGLAGAGLSQGLCIHVDTLARPPSRLSVKGAAHSAPGSGMGEQ